ncbi:MAG: ornithine cyclodeaminase family protein [Erythrobacter sp.]|nr:ornithine cyclodeaminase family protein [Erythrobacter sp.]MBO6527541.1 ornithine cyclodeaminase family protein [Erythrobacter sp.]MBO6530221.1 ornithine cyclodeaminase family protein [Erythrobacter sp.]
MTWHLLTPARCQAAVEQSMCAMSEGRLDVPLRSFVPIEACGSLGLMPAIANEDGLAGAKILSLIPRNPQRGLPAIQGLVALFSTETGALIGLVDGAAVTARRTAAASAIASRTLARNDVNSHGILGTGVQAYSHALAIQHAIPSILNVRIWGRNAPHAIDLAERLVAEHSIPARAAKLDDAASCDIVTAVTASQTPLIEHHHLHAGMHINLVGSHQPDRREASSAVMAAARIFVDRRAAALAEAGDILLAIAEGQIAATDIRGELGDVLLGRYEGRSCESDITVFKSLGNAGQDLYAAAAVLEAGREQSLV